MCVSLDRFRLRQFRKPREGDFVFRDLDAEVVNAERLLDEAFLGGEEVGEVSDRSLLQREADRKAGAFICFRFLCGDGTASR